MKQKVFFASIAMVAFLFCTGLFAQHETPSAQSAQTEPAKLQTAQEKSPVDGGFTWRASLKLSYNDAAVKLGKDNGQTENSLLYYYFALGVEADIHDFLTVGILAGMNSAYFKDNVDFVQLPLSLRFHQEKNNSMLFGLNAKSRLDINLSFSVVSRAEFLYFKEFTREIPFQLPLVTGQAVLKNSFFQFTVELLAQYDGLTGVTLFLGPQLNIISGEYTAEETIQTLNGVQTLSYTQKRALGLTAGGRWETGAFQLEAWGSAFSRGSLTVSVLYEF